MRRAFGATGLEVSALGLGGGALGDPALDERDAERLLHGALDLGVTFVDVARSYGCAEERLGRHLRERRAHVVLSTKGGYGVEGVADWTGEAVRRGIEEALGRLATSWIDVFHLHSCPRETAEREDVTRALEEARTAGKVRVVAYSGEGDALAAAVRSAHFGGVQCSANVFDQRCLDGAVSDARARGLGVVGKRPLGNAPWRFEAQPVGHYAEVYWRRMRAMNLDPSPLAWAELALRFAAFAPGVSTVIAGTSRLAHLEENVRALARGPLDSSVVQGLRDAFRSRDDGWEGQV